MSTDSICVGAVQLQSQDDVAANLASCRELVAEAHQRGAEFVLLPENFAFFGAEDQKARVAERLGDSAAPIQRALSELARAEQVVLIAGGFPERNEDGGPPFNSCLV
jgi:deaminated glutathione amidase